MAQDQEREVGQALDFEAQCQATNTEKTSQCPRVATWVFQCLTPGCATGGLICDEHHGMHASEVRHCVNCGARGVMREIVSFARVGVL